MANRFLGAGEETKNHLLAGFDTLSDEGSGRRGGAGFGVLPLVEKLWTAVAAAAAQQLSSSPSDATSGPSGREEV